MVMLVLVCACICVREEYKGGVESCCNFPLSLLFETSVLGRLVISVWGGGVSGSVGCIRKTKRTASIMCPLYPVH